MTTKDLIDSLRVCANSRLGCVGCKVAIQDYKCVNRLRSEAADRLEELSAELGAEQYRHDRYVDFELAEAAELQKMKKQIKTLEKSNRNWRRKVQRLRNTTHSSDS